LTEINARCTVNKTLNPIEGHLDCLQYKHILQNVMVPSV
jgi:hypothetical protein